MKKSRKPACHLANSNIAIDNFPTLQISVKVVVLFEKIYDGESILTVLSNIGEDLQYRCFNEGFSVNLFQMTETGFAEQEVPHRMGSAPICLKISA
jgi:hypothetical protein